MKALNAVARQKISAWLREKLVFHFSEYSLFDFLTSVILMTKKTPKLAPSVDVYLARICPRHLVEEEKHLKMSQAEKTFINSLLKVI